VGKAVIEADYEMQAGDSLRSKIKQVASGRFGVTTEYLVSADQIEKAGAQQYLALKQEAAQKRSLAPEGQPQLIRLREIASRIIPFSYEWNERARRWRWEVTLLGDPTLNAFCMPGGKIAFYYGILEQLKLEDDEVAAIMGHEVAHALREHARERMGKSTATSAVVELGSALLGLGNLGRAAAGLPMRSRACSRSACATSWPMMAATSSSSSFSCSRMP
jgi:Zn-dependent protease with chaperone function